MANWFERGGEAYARYRPDYPDALAIFLADIAPDRACAVDVGCGNGQFTCQLARHFASVVGIDPSQDQIANAFAGDHVRYICAPAEETGLPDRTASLITAAQAAHWFDLPRFYDEVVRIAAPGAILALISYGVPEFDAVLQPRFHRFYWDEIGSYWPPERRLVESGYADLAFPFAELPYPAMEIRRDWTLEAFLGYLSTWSALRRVEKAGRQQLVNRFVADIERLWGNPDIARQVIWPIRMRVGRIRKHQAAVEFARGADHARQNKGEDDRAMKAMRLRKPASLDNLRLETAEAPPPGPGEIKVRLRAASLNFRDGLVVNGFFPAADGLIPLSDGAGEVIEVGAGVTEFGPGDAVVSVFHPNWQDGHTEKAELNNSPGGPADGFACEQATRPARHFTRAPDGFSHAESATLTCAGVTAWRAVVTDGRVKPGATVLVQGTGGVSLFALQFAKAAGAIVIATSSSADKLARLKALGADHVINYRDTPKWGEAALGLTGGLGVDHIIEVGGPNVIGQSFVAARTGGHIAIIGAVGGFDIDTMPFAIVQAKRLRLQAVTVGSRRDQIDMVNAIETHGIKPVIDRHFPLDQLADAFRHQASGDSVGKVCIDI